MGRGLARVPLRPVTEATPEQINEVIRAINDRFAELAVAGPVGPVQGQSALTIPAGMTNDLLLGDGVYIEISSPQGAATITGFAGGSHGRVVVIKSTGGSTLTIAEQSEGSQAANRILTRDEADVSIASAAAVVFIYDGVRQRWVETANVP